MNLSGEIQHSSPHFQQQTPNKAHLESFQLLIDRPRSKAFSYVEVNVTFFLLTCLSIEEIREIFTYFLPTPLSLTQFFLMFVEPI